MRRNFEDGSTSLLEQVEHSIRQTTHGRIRDLAVEEVQGRFVVRGRVPSYHTKQLALYAALELLPSDRFDMNILVS
ncbi:phospholipid-binding protein [Tautonia sociabilis]|uniref:phospholipid-binding protein n=1 Tax=Tautonia sociabilis TaxID=2080755 RepID=UPI001F46A14F|nr:phospholipid-binding protein [Tautonia sociabilis]